MNDALVAIGQRLRAAREAQGLAVEQVAARLRLMNRQVAAMESGDFAALGQAVFARGFVRNYAKLLGLDVEDIVAQMSGELPQESLPKPEVRPPRAARRWRSAWLWGAVAVVVLIGLPFALYTWLSGGTGEEGGRSADSGTISAQVSRPDARPEQKPAIVAAIPLAAPQAPAALSGAPAPGARMGAVGGGVALGFAADAWVDIRDAQGRQLAHGLYRAGQEINLQEAFPLYFVIGNAGQVSVSYAGHALDLHPYTTDNVARFSVAADGAAKALKP